MKKWLPSLALVALIMPASAFADATAANAAPQRSPLAQALNLTPEQEQKIFNIQRTYEQKIRALMQEAQQKMKAVLTPEQLKKLEEIEAQRRAMIEQMRRQQMQQQQGNADQ